MHSFYFIFSATVFNNAKQHINVYGDDVEVDYRGYEVKDWEREMGSREGGKHQMNVYRDDVEVDYRGYEVNDWMRVVGK